MKKSDIVFVAFLVVIGLYFYYFYFLVSNISVWIYDLQNCYKNMEFISFLENHLNIFLYLALFFVATFYIFRTFIHGIKSMYGYFQLTSYIKNNLYKKFKNLYIINSDQLVAFNIGFFKRKIILSKPVLDIFSKEERKNVFLHEKGHLLGGDSYKLFIFSILTNLFPKKLGDRLLKDFSLLKEVEADMFCAKERSKIDIANTVLRFYSYKSEPAIPMMNSYLHQRIQFLLGDASYEKIKPETAYLRFSMLLVIFIALSYLFNYCFCNMH